MDDEIQETVEALLGKGIKVVDCEKKSSMKEEEVLLINGCPITLEGDDGTAIKEALMRGNIPNCHLLNDILVRAGILKAPVKLETSLSVKSSLVTREQVTVAKGGQLVDERSTETKQDNFYTSCTSEIWQPVGIAPRDPTGKLQNMAKLDVPKASLISRNGDKDNNRLYRETKISSVTKKVRCEGDTDNGQCDSPDESDYIHSSILLPEHELTFSGLHLMSLKDCTCGDSHDHCSQKSLDTGHSAASDRNAVAQNVRRLPPQISYVEAVKSASFDANAHIPSAMQAHDNELLTYHDGILMCGSLDALIQHLVPCKEYYPDRNFIFAFLLTARMFVTPDKLLKKIYEICVNQNRIIDNNSTANNKRVSAFVPKLLQLVEEWVRLFPRDFKEVEAMSALHVITDMCMTYNSGTKATVSDMFDSLQLRFKDFAHYQAYTQDIGVNDVAQFSGDLVPSLMMELCKCPITLAQHLCHIELERLSFIGGEEFIYSLADDDAAKNKDGGNGEENIKMKGKAPSIRAYVQWFNRLSQLVATDICKKQPKKKKREKQVEYWVEVARACFNIGNFNSLMAIVAGLNMTAVVRLKKTVGHILNTKGSKWAKLQNMKFSILEHQMNPSANFNSYRSSLKAAIWRSNTAKTSEQRIVIPFFTLLVKDMYFLNETSPNYLPNGLVNFQKFWNFAKQINDFIAWRGVKCPFPRDLQLVTYLESTPIFSEKALEFASYEIEPPDTHQEKERYKILKYVNLDENVEINQFFALKMKLFNLYRVKIKQITKKEADAVTKRAEEDKKKQADKGTKIK